MDAKPKDGISKQELYHRASLLLPIPKPDIRSVLDKLSPNEENADFNMLVISMFIGIIPAITLSQLSHRGELRVPLKKNKKIVELIGEKKEEILRSDDLRSFFRAQGAFSIRYPTWRNFHDKKRLIRAARYEYLRQIEAIEKESALHITQAEKARVLGVSQPFVNRLCSAKNKEFQLYKEQSGEINAFTALFEKAFTALFEKAFTMEE